MSFTNPTALLGAVFAVPIVVFYLLKIRMRQVPVATTMFWEEVFEEKPPRAIWKRLRHVWSLLMQLVFLGLLVIAIADPVLDSSVGKQRRVVVILDNSASMQAADTSGVSRFEVAVERVERVIESLRNSDEMAIVECGNRAQVACGLTTHSTTLHTALSNIVATDGPTRLEDGIQLAQHLIGEHQHGELILVTDTDRPKTVATSVVWSVVGSDVGNVAVTGFQVRRTPLNPLGYEILLEIANYNEEAVSVTVDLSLDDGLLDVIPLSLDAGEIYRNVIPKTSAAGGILTARVSVNTASGAAGVLDGLSADNLVWAVLPRERRIPVTLVTEGNWFLQRVLEASDLIDLTVTSQVPPTIADESVLVLHRIVPEKIPEGNVLVVDPSTGSDLWEVTGDIHRQLVGDQDKDSKLLSFVRLDNVALSDAKQLNATSEHEVLVETVSGSPLYLKFSRSGGDVLLLNVDLEHGDLPLRTSFPILFTNALTWFSGSQGGFVSAISTGNAARIEVPGRLFSANNGATSSIVLTSPDGTHCNIPHRNDSVVLPAVDQAGVYTLSPSSPASQRTTRVDSPGATIKVACNIVNQAESNLRLRADVPQQAIAAAGYSGSPIWFLLAAIAIVLLITEWFLFQRRWIN